MTERRAAFDHALDGVVRPALAGHGFVFDRSRTFRRIDRAGGVGEIINFQLGQRSLAGKFTVNLGVLQSEDPGDVPLERAFPYHCAPGNEKRIGLLLPPRWAVLQRIPLIGFLFAPNDRWWTFSDDRAHTSAQLRQVTGLLVAFGVPWLEGRAGSAVPADVLAGSGETLSQVETKRRGEEDGGA